MDYGQNVGKSRRRRTSLNTGDNSDSFPARLIVLAGAIEWNFCKPWGNLHICSFLAAERD